MWKEREIEREKGGGREKESSFSPQCVYMYIIVYA